MGKPDLSTQKKALDDMQEIKDKLNGIYKMPVQERFDTLMSCFCSLLVSHYRVLQRLEELENK